MRNRICQNKYNNKNRLKEQMATNPEALLTDIFFDLKLNLFFAIFCFCKIKWNQRIKWNQWIWNNINN